MSRLTLIGIGVGAGILAIPSFAHHSSSMFDQQKTITLVGTVKEFQFANPHAWLIVNVENPDKTTTVWGFEVAPGGPSFLMGRGVRKSDLPVGTRVTATGHPMRDGRPAATWNKVVRESDGRVFAIANEPPNPDAAK